MYFDSGYKYEIPEGIHYTWSSMYEMEDHGVFRSSDVGDLFYLISMDRKTFLLAYNAKMFEYCESNEGNNKYPRQSRGYFTDGQSPMLVARASRRASTVCQPREFCYLLPVNGLEIPHCQLFSCFVLV